MSRIGGVGSLGTDQLRALRTLQSLANAMSQNQTRLNTLSRLNAAKDDPAGMVSATLLRSELAAAEAASQSVSRADALLSTADGAAAEVLTQLQSARTLVLEAAGGSLSAAEIDANQVEVDAILTAIDDLARTDFAGRRLLDGSSSYRVSGANSSQVLDVDVLDKNTAEDVTVSINVTTQATRATNTYTGGTLAADVTLSVTGSLGTTQVELSTGATKDDIAAALNDVTYLTGVSATVVGNDVRLDSTGYGSGATVEVTALEGTFTMSTAGEVAGTDAVATINGEQVTGEGSTFRVYSSDVSLVIEVAPAASGSLTSFTVSGEGLNFIVGAKPTDTARVAMPNLTTASLGGIDGKLHSIGSGGDNDLSSGNTAKALRIIDDAIADVTRGQAVIGAFQRFTLDSSADVLSSNIEHMSESLSLIADTDVALETVALANNQLRYQATLEALSISSMNHQGVLDLLRITSLRF